MKKILVILCSILFLADLFCQEIIIVDSDETSELNFFETYKNYSSLLKDYLDTGNEESLKEYSIQSRNFYSPENYNTEMQPYLVGESVFYWNYFKPQIDKEDLVRVIDGNVISFWTYLNDNNSFTDDSILVINFAKSYCNLLNDEFKFTFPISDFDESKLIVSSVNYKLPGEKTITKNLYKALSQAEGMQKRFEKNKIAAGTDIKLSDSAFISLCNSPDLLYVILNYDSYKDLYNSFLKTLSTWLKVSYSDLAKTFTKDQLSYKNNFIIFPDIIFEKVYPSIPIDEKKDEVISRYELSYYFSKFGLRNLQEGFDLKCILSENELEIYNNILNNNFSVLTLEDNFVFDFVNKIKFVDKFDYFKNILKLNLVEESK